MINRTTITCLSTGFCLKYFLECRFFLNALLSILKFIIYRIRILGYAINIKDFELKSRNVAGVNCSY